jgi:hypothetical protein
MSGMPTVFTVAKSYIERGWSVIPLNGKKPALPSWKQYQDRLPTLGEIAQWFGMVNAVRHNIGVVCGAISGVVVVDCDSREDGVWWWKNRPRTERISKTGRGVHLWYAYAPTGNRSSLWQRGIDVRGDGGYVVVPPSIHPSGTPYEWVSEGEMPVFNPEWISTLGSEPRERTMGSNGEISRARAYIMAIMAISGQGGHNATFRAACKLRDFGLQEEDAFGLLSEWNETNAKPRWTSKELRHKLDDAYKQAEVPG